MESGKIIGVDLGGTNVRAGLIYGSELLLHSAQAISSTAESKIIIDEVISTISKVFEPDVEAIGIGVPSIVDEKNGIVYDVQNIPSWKKVELKKILENYFDVPVFVNNDANCFALGERYFGQGQAYDNFVGLISGTGLGAGIIIDGQLYSGEFCGAGEFGMLPYKDSIFEDYCSGQFFENYYNLSGSEIFKLAENNDENALRAFREYGVHLGSAIKAILFTLTPQAIVLGGSVRKSFNFFEHSLKNELENFAFPKLVENLKIEISNSENPAIFGAAALYLNSKIGVENA